MRGRNQTNDRGESKLSVSGLPPGLTVGALHAAAALAVIAQLVCHRYGGMGVHAVQPLRAARRAVTSVRSVFGALAFLAKGSLG